MTDDQALPSGSAPAGDEGVGRTPALGAVGDRSGRTWRPQRQETTVQPGLYLDPFTPETVRYWTGTAWAPESIALSDDPGRRAARDLQQQYARAWAEVRVEPGAADDAEERRRRPPALSPNRALAWLALAVLAVAVGHGLNSRSHVGDHAHGGGIAAVIGGCYTQDLSLIVRCTDRRAAWTIVEQAPACEDPLVSRAASVADPDGDVFCLRDLRGNR